MADDINNNHVCASRTHATIKRGVSSHLFFVELDAHHFGDLLEFLERILQHLGGVRSREAEAHAREQQRDSWKADDNDGDVTLEALCATATAP